MPVPMVQVDAFTSEPYRGNPAAVCVLQQPASTVWMQAVAREMNLSETAFLHPVPDGFALRWFTPTTEIDLCGHATLASAHVLWEEGTLAAGEPARFLTRSGVLTATRASDMIELDFPAVPARPVPDGPAFGARLSGLLGADVRYAAQSEFDYLAELSSEAEVRRLTPDLAAIARLPVRGVIVTSASGTAGVDFVSRFFGPAAGVPEDPVTGSAHCTLGPFWGDRLGRSELVGYQASARGGTVRVRLAGDRVVLAGQAVTVLRGVLLS